MTTLPLLREVVSPALVRGVGLALLHSLWQGGVLALLLAGVLPLLRRQRAELRYALAASALGALVLAVGLTFGWYYDRAPRAGAAPVVAAAVARPPALNEARGVGAALPARPAPAQPLAWLTSSSSSVEQHLPLVVAAWLLGLLLMSGRLAGGLLYASRLRRAGTQALGAEWQQRLAALAARAGLRQPVALLESARVAGPLVLGHLRPVILLPLGAVAGLSPSLLEALLAHELAHIVRRDYLLNLGLAVVEVLFFYHPAVWFMAHCLRAERENCCDDQAAALCGGDRLRVARALAALAELETAATARPRLALAAAGGGRGSLLARVRRLALSRPQPPTLGEGLLAGSLTLLGLLGLSTGVVLAARPAQTISTQTAPITSAADTSRRSAAAAPPLPPVPAATERTVEAEVVEEILQRRRQWPPRRSQASTVVIEKDKKGRVVNLTLDGQPIETATPGKKARRSKTVRTVEVVRVPERGERLENRTFSFNFPTDEVADQALRSVRQNLADALRNPDLTEEQRREIKRSFAKLQRNPKSLQNDLSLNLRFDSSHERQDVQRRMEAEQRRLLESQRRFEDVKQQFQLRTLDGTFEQPDRTAAQADHDAAHADREGDRAALVARRAELRARMAADAAELRALENAAPRPPRAPRVPLSLLPPMGPQAPLPPAPPAAPNTAKLREMLRQDGLIQDDKHFSFELNDRGGRVNGRDLTPDQVSKYRQLLKLPAAKTKGSKSSFSISVDEK